MRLNQTVAYDVLVEWEQGDGWPDVEQFVAVMTELAALEELAKRYRRLAESCINNENLRHSRPSQIKPIMESY